jgi:hypothetical protein
VEGFYTPLMTVDYDDNVAADLRVQRDAAERERDEATKARFEAEEEEESAKRRAMEYANADAAKAQRLALLLAESRVLLEALDFIAHNANHCGPDSSIAQKALDLAPLTAAEVERVKRLEQERDEARADYDEAPVTIGDALNEGRLLRDALETASTAFANGMPTVAAHIIRAALAPAGEGGKG